MKIKRITFTFLAFVCMIFCAIGLASCNQGSNVFIDLSISEKKINVGETFDLSQYLTIDPNDSNVVVKWESNDTSKVVVDNDGKVTGVSATQGVFVRAYINEDDGYKPYCVFTVFGGVDVTDVTDNGRTNFLTNVGDHVEVTTFFDANLNGSTDVPITWTSQPEGIATIDNLSVYRRYPDSEFNGFNQPLPEDYFREENCKVIFDIVGVGAGETTITMNIGSKSIEYHATVGGEYTHGLTFERDRVTWVDGDEVYGYFVTGIGEVTEKDIVIPLSYQGEPVIAIGSSAFKDTDISSITLPNTIIEIKSGAFGNTDITSIKLPNSVTYVSRWAFNGCNNLEIVELSSFKFIDDIISNDLVTINELFGLNENDRPVIDWDGGWHGTAVNKIIVSNGTTSITEGAFSGCEKLTQIVIPESVTEIGEAAFYGCTGIETIKLPSKLTKIEKNLFAECSSLENIELPNGIIEIGNYAFENCGNLGNVTLPDSLTKIGVGAFSGCRSFTEITIPNGVTALGDQYGGGAFSNCVNLETINLPDNLTTIGYGTFSGCAKLNNVTIPNGVIEIAGAAFAGCESLTSIVIPEGVKKIDLVSS